MGKNLGRTWAGGEVPMFEKRRIVRQEAERDERFKRIQKKKELYRKFARRPPLTKQQKKAGARRVI